MDFTFKGTVTAVNGPYQVVDRNTGAPTGATEIVFRVEEIGEQYPDSIILRVYDKAGDGSRLAKAFDGFPGFQGAVTVGMTGVFHCHPRGSMGVSQKTGKAYAINDAFQCWRVDAPDLAATAQPAVQAAPQMQFNAPSPQYGAQPANNPYGQYPGQQMPGMNTQGFPQSGWQQ